MTSSSRLRWASAVLLAVTLAAAWAQKPPPPPVEEKLPKEPPVQPIAYSHKKHVAMGMKCGNCHTIKDPGFQAGIPGTAVCMGCHSSIKTDSPEIKKLAGFAAAKKPVPWARVYTVPDYVWFSHAVHVTDARLECAVCHGAVAEREVMFKEKPTNMFSCMQCHAKHQASNGCDACHNSQ